MESAAQSIVSKFGQVLVEELQEIHGVGDKVVHLRDELATMNAALRVISEAEQSSVNHLVREWEKQVHDLAYDAEDCADTYSLRIIRPIPRPPNDIARYQLARAKGIARYHYEKLVLQSAHPRSPPPARDIVGAPLIFSWARYLLAHAKQVARYPYEKLVLQRTLAADIKALLARTTIVSERRVRYGINRATLPRAAFLAPISATSISANALRPADDPDQFVGIREQANDLADKIKGIKAPVHDQRDKIKPSVRDEDDKIEAEVIDQDDKMKAPVHDHHDKIKAHDHHDKIKPTVDDEDDKIKAPVHDEDDKSLKVFSIVGFGGLGKTTLAMELCRQLDVEFPYQARVSVSQAFDVEKDMKGLLVRVLQQIQKEKADAKAKQTTKEEEVVGQIDMTNVDDLSSMIKELLDHKRYLIVVDDVWSLPAWEAIRSRLPENNCGSRIIVTTRIEAVAKAASASEYFVHHMKPLELEASEKMFVKRVFGSKEEGTCPSGLEEHMKKILKKCGGLPLAIVSIASLLASYRSVEDTVMWERVSRSIGSQMESHPTLEGMRQLITLSYDYLPHHLKACLMYLSIFPEDYVIVKDRLLFRWIAEGLITEKRGLTLLEVAEEYLNELISRNMIQLVKFVSTKSFYSREVDVEGCRVHDMILEVMVSKSQESNFVSLVGRQYEGMPHGHGKVRRLSIHDNDHEGQHHARHGIETMNLQHVRSLTTFQRYGLDKLLNRLGEFKLLRVLDLEDCKALRNKHMRDVCRLYLLRFLSLRGTRVSKMPRKVGNLEHLETLDVTDMYIGRRLPQTVTKLSKLECLRSHGWLLPRGLGNMKRLREVDMGVLDGRDVSSVAREIGKLTRLQVLSIEIGKHVDGGCLSELASSLSKTSTLRSLILGHRSSGNLDFLLGVTTPPPLLQRLGMYGSISQLPDWISSLIHLTKFEIGHTKLAGDQLFGVLCKLPNLQSVQLLENTYRDEELVARPEHSFPVLRILKVYFSSVYFSSTVLTFKEGSMTKLEMLVLVFNHEKMSVVGVENLENLKEVKLRGRKGNPAMECVVKQLKTHPKSNQIKVVADWY